jgi:hypothetical protein
VREYKFAMNAMDDGIDDGGEEGEDFINGVHIVYFPVNV